MLSGIDAGHSGVSKLVDNLHLVLRGDKRWKEEGKDTVTQPNSYILVWRGEKRRKEEGKE